MPLTVAAITKLCKFKTEGHSQHLSILNKIEWAKDVLANWWETTLKIFPYQENNQFC